MKKFTTSMPRLVFCMLGNWEDFERIRKIINTSGFIFDDEYSILENDSRMVESFTASVDRVNYSMKDEEWMDIYKHKAVAYFVAPEASNEDELRIIAGKALILVKLLFEDLGAIALKCETAGIAHGKDRWVELSEKFMTDEDNKEDYLYKAYVRLPLSANEGFYSCGMHILGYPDVLYSGEEDEFDSVASMNNIAKVIMNCGGDFDEIEEELEDYDYVELIPPFYDADSFQCNPYGLVSVQTDESGEDDDDDDDDDDE